MVVHCREITKDDLPKWEKLGKGDFLKKDFCSAKYLIKIWDNISGWVLVDENDEWIGCCFLNKGHHAFNVGGIHFLEIWVAKKFRGRGFGKQLIKILFDNAIGKRKSVCVDPVNVASLELFKKMGFVQSGMHKHWLLLYCDKNFDPQFGG